MTKPYCGTFCAHSSLRHKSSVLLNSCKTRPQPWRDVLHQSEQSDRTRIFVPWFYLEVKLVWMCWMSLLYVLADGGLCSGFGSSWPGRMPVCSGFVRQCFNRGCSLHAPRHGHWNCKHVFTVHFDGPAVVYVCIIPTDQSNSSSLLVLIHINRSLCIHTTLWMFIL